YLSADNKKLKIIPLILKISDELPLTLRDIQPINAINHTYDDTLVEGLRIVNGTGQTSLVSGKAGSVQNSDSVGVMKSSGSEERAPRDIKMQGNSTVSPTFAPMGILELGGAILPIMYFILAGLYPFGFDNNTQEFFLGSAAFLTGVFFI